MAILKKKEQGVLRPAPRPVSPGKGNSWLRRSEHALVRIGSIGLSVVSGHSMYWFYSTLNHIDPLQPYMTFIISLSIGMLGYVVLRGLTHRLMRRERIWVYIPMCLILLYVETISNFMMAAVGVEHDTWLFMVPLWLRGFMTFATYTVLSILPVFTIFLAWLDMDLGHAKNEAPVPAIQPLAASASEKMMAGNQSTQHSFGNGRAPAQGLPSYGTGYQPAQSAISMAPGVNMQNRSNNAIPPYEQLMAQEATSARSSVGTPFLGNNRPQMSSMPQPSQTTMEMPGLGSIR